MKAPQEPKPERKPYHGMTWPVRLIVYSCCGLVLMAIVQVRGRSEDLWWTLLIPPATGLLGVLFPQGVDWLFARINNVIRR